MVTRTVAMTIAIVLLSLIGAVAVVLVINFNGKDTPILIAAIMGFLTPTIGSMLTLLQAANNAQATAGVAAQVQDVNQKVNGHLTRLTQIVVDSASRNEAVNPTAAALLAQRTEVLTGNTIQATPPLPTPILPTQPEETKP